MIERVTDLPDGTLGFRVSGHIDSEDYTERMIPALREAVAPGTPVNLYVEIVSLDGMSVGAMSEDLKSAAQIGLPNRHLLERTALVTDLAWIRHVKELFGWLYPGEMRAFTLADAPAARDWLAGGDAGSQREYS